MAIDKFWLYIGFFGQILFFMRFWLQWIASETQKKSVIPISFWYYSVAGTLILLAYAIYRRDPVYIVGQGSGLFIYLRNLTLIARHKEQKALK